jgi:hypothetical protein
MIIVLIILLVLAVAGWPGLGIHQYGYGPSGILGVVLVILLVLFLMGRL